MGRAARQCVQLFEATDGHTFLIPQPQPQLLLWHSIALTPSTQTSTLLDLPIVPRPKMPPKLQWQQNVSVDIVEAPLSNVRSVMTEATNLSILHYDPSPETSSTKAGPVQSPFPPHHNQHNNSSRQQGIPGNSWPSTPRSAQSIPILPSGSAPAPLRYPGSMGPPPVPTERLLDPPKRKRSRRHEPYKADRPPNKGKDRVTEPVARPVSQSNQSRGSTVSKVDVFLVAAHAHHTNLRSTPPLPNVMPQFALAGRGGPSTYSKGRPPFAIFWPLTLAPLNQCG